SVAAVGTGDGRPVGSDPVATRADLVLELEVAIAIGRSGEGDLAAAGGYQGQGRCRAGDGICATHYSGCKVNPVAVDVTSFVGRDGDAQGRRRRRGGRLSSGHRQTPAARDTALVVGGVVNHIQRPGPVGRLAVEG